MHMMVHCYMKPLKVSSFKKKKKEENTSICEETIHGSYITIMPLLTNLNTTIMPQYSIDLSTSFTSKIKNDPQRADIFHESRKIKSLKKLKATLKSI